jgi:osmotically-inducible protein OsmY
MRRTQWALIACAGLVFAGAACDDTWRGVQKDTKENTEAARKKANDAGLDEAAAKAAAKAEEAAAAAKRGVKNLARDIARDDGDKGAGGKTKARIEEAARETGQELKAAGIHVNIKQALVRDDTIDASHIAVDADEDTRTVILRGSVPTIEQKVAAEKLARDRAKDYTVRNELAVMSGS